MAKQSPADQAKRLNEGCCPVHGLGMSQVDVWYVDDNEQPFTIVGCPRKDCGIKAKAYGIDGPCVLFDDAERAAWISLRAYEGACEWFRRYGRPPAGLPGLVPETA